MKADAKRIQFQAREDGRIGVRIVLEAGAHVDFLTTRDAGLAALGELESAIHKTQSPEDEAGGFWCPDCGSHLRVAELPETCLHCGAKMMGGKE